MFLLTLRTWKYVVTNFKIKYCWELFKWPHFKKGINIDGLTISDSSKSQLWPIFISILNSKELVNKVIPIGICHGCHKPDSLEQFLNPFVVDIQEILHNGISVNGVIIKLKMSYIDCDAPAKAFISMCIR